ncbi:hypothetical protein DQ384_20085 [Sphaerisporangium album]|uniref:Uncharacterized protein n=1 Tax=Sphaerisporangium album TaxID=509200 RepID=A0A367FGB0_9ACTN|nr:hypothetical protein DQ384_20085 [Sphaerisporangium album]
MFFDARGQERVLRVTWHDGTLVLSLWRGEMCTASFRMPMEDVGRLLDTLDEGYADAGGEYAEGHEGEHGHQDDGDEGEYADEGEYGEYREYPGTGQYARPAGAPDDGEYTQAMSYDDAYQDSYGDSYQEPYADDQGDYGHDPAYAQGRVPQDPEAPVPARGPKDVLVARGAAPAPDKLVASGGRPAEAPQGERPAPPVDFRDRAAHHVPPQALPSPAEFPGGVPMPSTGAQAVPPGAGDYGVPSGYGEPSARRAPAEAPGRRAQPEYVPPASEYGAPSPEYAAASPEYGAPAAGYEPSADYGPPDYGRGAAAPQPEYGARPGYADPATPAEYGSPQYRGAPEPGGPAQYGARPEYAGSAQYGAQYPDAQYPDAQYPEPGGSPDAGVNPDFTPPTGYSFSAEQLTPDPAAPRGEERRPPRGEYGPGGEYATREEYSPAGYGTTGDFQPGGYGRGGEPGDPYPGGGYGTPPLDYSGRPGYPDSTEYPPPGEYGGARYGADPGDVVPRENLIVNDSLPYGSPPAGHADPGYQPGADPSAYGWGTPRQGQGSVDPADPLGLGAIGQRPMDHTDPQLSRPYVPDAMNSTGERARPEAGRPRPDEGGRPYSEEKGREW